MESCFRAALFFTRNCTNFKNYSMYFLRIWFATIIVSPILLCLFLGITVPQKGLFTYFERLWPMMVMGAFFSIPTILLQSVIFVLLERAGFNQKLLKIILSVLAVTGVCISFFIIKISFVGYAGPIIYSTVMMFCIWYFRSDTKTAN